nr:uncharacterized protein LOC121832233 isoform X2 [Peromyscus maniculatus bairdii]
MMRMERSYPHLSGGSCAHNLKTATLPWAASPPALGSVVLWSRAVSQDSQPGQTMVQGHRGQRRQRIYLAFSQLTPGPEKLNQPTTARRMGSMLGPSHYTSSGCKSTQQSVGGERGYRPDSALLLPGFCDSLSLNPGLTNSTRQTGSKSWISSVSASPLPTPPVLDCLGMVVTRVPDPNSSLHACVAIT